MENDTRSRDEVIARLAAGSPQASQPTEEISIEKETLAASEERLAFEEATKATEALMEHNSVSRLFMTLVSLRQASVLVAKRLDELCEAAHPLSYELLLQVVRNEGLTPIDLHQLMRNLVSVGLPVIGELADQVVGQSHAEQLKAYQEADKKRRESPILLPFPYLADGTCELQRAASLVLVGPTAAVRYVVRQVIEGIKDPQSSVLYLMSHRPPSPFCSWAPDLAGLPGWTALAQNEWRGCTDSKRHFGEWVLGLAQRRQQGQVFDLLLAEQLPNGHTAGYTGRPPEAKAGDAHKLLRALSDRVGAGLIATVETGLGYADMGHPAFEQLRQFTMMVPISIDPREQDSLISVGGWHEWLVPNEELEPLQPKLIVTP